ncbi:MAG: 4Fe-4S dicluster domain-containing protein [Bacteroides sp.]|jgi:ferredoxin|nr:4Fe-4S dicluster domain-containing protein [Bacteroides sp.]
MARYYEIERTAWDKALIDLLSSFRVFAPILKGKTLDYQLIQEEHIPHIVYNIPKPVVPLKTFFLPIKENVVVYKKEEKPIIILGIPACDLSALDLLDKFFMTEVYNDHYYAGRREGSVLIGCDCHSANKHCHCTSYGLNPFPENNQDMTINMINGHAIISSFSMKGEELLSRILGMGLVIHTFDEVPERLTEIRLKVKRELEKANRLLPNYQETTDAVINSDKVIWEKYAKKCVSCGACATICPTCTCFLLIDRPGFEKVRQLDACQYPGFERTAGGENPLKKLEYRFKNRYLCKYLYRPEKFDAIACTGCGRCIEACIAKINKNELLIELTK